MALDGLVIRALTAELQKLTGRKIHKIHQPNEHDIVMQVRCQGETIRLLLSANPTYPRLHISRQQFINPLEAPMFCMLLRKHCESGTIQDVQQIMNERIVHIRILHRDELGDQRLKTIVVELTGRHSNIILLDSDTNTVLDGIRHVTPAISSYRVVMPGCMYTAPPEQHKANPFDVTRRDIEQAIGHALENDPDAFASMSRKLENALVSCFSGVSPLAAREIVHRTLPGESGPSAHSSAVAAVFADLIDKLQGGQDEPNIVTPPSGKADFSVIALTHMQGDIQRYKTISDCLEAFYGNKAERDTIKQRVSDLLRLLQNERNKNIAKLKKLSETIEEAKDADKYRILGELLTASLHLAAKGATAIEAINYYDEQQSPVTIKLDPMLTPPQNAQRYFRKYNKMKNSVAVVEQQMISAREEIRYLDEVLQQLGSAAMIDIEEIREELIEQGYIRRRGKQPKRKKKDRPALTCFTSSEGVPIYVGKNNTQNEYLTNRLAHSNDTWLHTKDIPGSHVVIHGEFGDETLNEAAMLAAYYSQAKESSRVPVDYTLIRHVRKPSGAKPGFVIYDKQKTLFVTPDEQRIQKLDRL